MSRSGKAASVDVLRRSGKAASVDAYSGEYSRMVGSLFKDLLLKDDLFLIIMSLIKIFFYLKVQKRT